MNQAVKRDLDKRRALVRRTFQIVRDVGKAKEKRLWADGISNWAEFLGKSESEILAGRTLDRAIREEIQKLESALLSGDLETLSRSIAEREHWRLYRLFESQTAFFDIEADAERVPTVASVLTCEGLYFYRRGYNLPELEQELKRWPIWVTFNGKSFDAPILAKYFETKFEPNVHIDLKVLSRFVKYSGGLKSIEKHLGFERPSRISSATGASAIDWWREHNANRKSQALKLLAEYNLYDTVSLKSVLEWCVNRAIEQNVWECEPWPVFDRAEALYDISKIILSVD